MHSTERSPKRLHTADWGFALTRAIINLRALLRQIGRAEFRAYGYAGQLRGYRQALLAGNTATDQGADYAQ